MLLYIRGSQADDASDTLCWYRHYKAAGGGRCRSWQRLPIGGGGGLFSAEIPAQGHALYGEADRSFGRRVVDQHGDNPSAIAEAGDLHQWIVARSLNPNRSPAEKSGVVTDGIAHAA